MSQPMSLRAAVVTSILACAVFVVVVVVFMADGPESERPAPQAPALVARIAALESAVAKITERLDRSTKSRAERSAALAIESKAHRGDDGEPAVSKSGDSKSGDPGAKGDAKSKSDSKDLDEFHRRLESLEFAFKTMEGDPVERGHSYLASGSPSLRREGLRYLAKFARHDADALTAIRDALNDPDAGVRLQALDVLADGLEGAGDSETMDRVYESLEDPDPNVRRRAMEALIQLRGKSKDRGDSSALVEVARRGLEDADAGVRAAAARALGRLHANEAAPALVAALSDSEGEVRKRALESLIEFKDPAAVATLREIYTEASGRETGRREAAEIAVRLRELGDAEPFAREAAHIAELATTSANEKERRWAIQALGRHAREPYRDLLLRATEDPNPGIREAAERALRGKDD
jgi:HEAT repeat protein